jgi:hypothetical protein
MRTTVSAPFLAFALSLASFASAQETVIVYQSQPAMQTQQPANAPQVGSAPQATKTTVVEVPTGRTTTTAAVVPRSRPDRDVETEVVREPNQYLLVSGAVLLGVPYLTSFVVASQSQHPGDSHLYVPIAGPWLDLYNRPSCSAASTNCDVETTNKVGLVIDGILQGVGTLQMFGAFVFPEKRIVTRSRRETASLRITPAKVGSTGYGLAA